MEELRLYTREEVAELFHVHVNTVTMLKDSGVLHAIKIGKGYMFTKKSILDFETNYIDLDVSNLSKALESRSIVEARMVA